MSMRIFILTRSLFILISFGIGSLVFAQQTDSAQQALEQLRMLQKRLAADSGTKEAEGAQKQDAAQKQPADPNQAQNQKAGAIAAPVTISPSENETLDKLAYEGMTQQLFPLSPEEIIRLKQMYHTNEYAKESPAGTPPKPTATSQMVNLSPGSTPPVIRLAQGFVSSLVFLDSTGAPWPISAYDLGDPAAFNIQWDKTSNTLMIQSTKLYTYGNLAVRLIGLNTPVMLTLIPGQKAVDYRVDLRIQGYGPNAKTASVEIGLPPSANDVLLHVLDGVPPPGSTRLTVSGGDARAWLLHEKMYVRTNLTILSPGWIGSMTSADGMHAYEMQKSPVLLVSWHGKVMQLKVEGL
ncbi:DotH/IcmK family type IV secretion protein [Legionella impletisoli]|uniref:Type IV secretion system protein IcmK n=2 Tax=Legionella impletisoli TaxID=343510 RepID=A0A917NDH7_9GAMM|nr:type IV secretion system protein IcmK [Legionella impletisoli]